MARTLSVSTLPRILWIELYPGRVSLRLLHCRFLSTFVLLHLRAVRHGHSHDDASPPEP